MLFSIAAWTRPSPWHEAVLRPGSLFLVGDPKQAIYRFRGADVEAYALSRRLIEAQPTGAILDVTANFRSQRAIIEHVNACFDVVLSTPSQPGYVALSATVPDREVRKTLNIVSAIRGLQPKTEVPGKVLNRDALLARVKQHVATDVPASAMTNEGMAYQLLTLIPAGGFDYTKQTFSLLESQLAGYYQPADPAPTMTKCG
jgi:hypothetical protein